MPATPTPPTMPPQPPPQKRHTPSRASTLNAVASPGDRRLPQIRPLDLLRAAGSTLAALRYLPIFTPRQTLARWRSHRAMRAAAREARDPRLDRRDWGHRFRLNGLTWHHLYIAQDLRRIALFLREVQTRLDALPGTAPAPPAVTALVPLERCYAYLLDNVWDVYNALEKDVLFPWVEGGVQDNPALGRALQLFGKERTRIEDAADLLQSRFSRLVCSTGYPYSSMGPCAASRRLSATRARRLKRKREAQDAKARAVALSGAAAPDEDARRKKASLNIREGYVPTEDAAGKVAVGRALRRVSLDDVRQVAVDLATIIEDTERLHKTERGLLYPLIASTFPEREQARLTNVLVYSMRSTLAKFIITIYHQAVEKNASRAQWKWYRREVPLPIRAYTPVWRARLYDGSPLGWLRTTPVKELGR